MLFSFHDGNLSGEVILEPGESHHLTSVRRAREGETVTVLNGKGILAVCKIVRTDPRKTVLKVESTDKRDLGIPPLQLAQALPLGKTMETIIQKAAELGTARIVPLCTERSELRMDADRAARKMDKWKLTAIEAVKQCGNPFLPEIDGPVSLRQFLTSETLPTARLVCSLEDDAHPLTDIIPDLDTSGGLVIAIGPEGDFSPTEYETLRKNAFQPVALGPLVLRADTAAITALALASDALRHKSARIRASFI